MTTNTAKPLRLWPGVALVATQWLLFYGVRAVAGEVEVFGLPLAVAAIFAGLFLAVAILAWWLFFSRAPWVERVGALVLMAIGILILRQVAHASMVGAHMGASLFIFPIPGLCLALVLWAAATQHLSAAARRAALVGVIALACLPWALLRTAGVFGGGSEYHWRWTPTPEELLLAHAQHEPQPRAARELAPAPQPPDVPPTRAEEAPSGVPATERLAQPHERGSGESEAPASRPEPASAEPAVRERGGVVTSGGRAEWPGFRGAQRDSVVHGVQIETNWSASPPVELWRHPIGPGWSSFAVEGDLIYTQEQRGEQELVSCYRLSTGEPVWRHADPVRFWESNGGAGPRATPTLHDGRVFAFGATGILNALDARTGKRLWTRNVATDLNRRVPDWGFSSSPLVVNDIVVVAAAATLAGYDVSTGELRWQGPRYGASYSSPHRVVIDGVEQIVLLGGPGALSVSPTDGTVLWEHKWVPGSIIQPAVTPDGDVLVNAIAATGGVGTRRLHITRTANGWHLEERWTTSGLKPYFNDFVIHKGHGYGFDGSIMASIDLSDGTRKWKGGRFGNGQTLLLAEQDLLLVIGEDGELALVQASPDRFTEVARFRALDAKTWNHPVVVRDVLLVRNGEEMAAFRLPTLATTR